MVVGDFANYGVDAKADSPTLLHMPKAEKFPELELKDFIEPKKEQPEAGCPTGCNGKKGCCPAFEKATTAEIAKTVDLVKDDFAKFYGADFLPSKTLT